jgi:hypothetical protein
MKASISAVVCALACAAGATALSAEPTNKTDAVNATKPPPAKTVRHFGIAPAGITSPEMEAALQAMDEASILPGQKHTITRMRWTDEAVPKFWYVGLWGPKVDDALLAMTAFTPDLSTIDLHEPHVSDEGMRSLAKLPKLRYLAIKPIERYVKPGFDPLMYCFPDLSPRTDRPRVTGAGLAALGAAPALEGLDLADALVEGKDLGSLRSMPALAHLGLPCQVDAAALEHMQACRRLHGLTLANRDVSAEEIERLAAWKNLRKLTLLHVPLSDAALEAVGRLGHLQTLELIDCGLTDERLARLKLPSTVTTLSLRQNDIHGPGLGVLAGTAVTTLGLEYTDIGDDTLRHLLPLESVRKLSLQHCAKITDAGIRIGSLQHMKHLEELNLRGQKQITDASLDDLAKFGFLRSLGVRSVGITNAGVEQLKKAMPETFVFR